MNDRGPIVAALMISASLSGIGASPAFSQAAAPARPSASLPGHDWASIAKLPDWGGVWEAVLNFGRARGGPAEQPSLTPEYAAKLAAFRAEQKEGREVQTPQANCVPFAMPASMRLYPVEFLFTPGKITVAIETYSQMRRIFTDGRALPEDPDLTYQGYSVGRWEGTTLVVNTIGLLPETTIGPGIGHSDQLRIEERIRLTGPDTLEINQTIHDSKVLTKPWTTVQTYQRHRDWEIREYICQQNNRDGADEHGRPFMRLEPGSPAK